MTSGWSERNPFSDNPGPFGFPPPSPPSSTPPTSTSKLVIVMLVGLAGALLLGVLVCCGGGLGLVYWGQSTVAPQIVAQVRDQPAIREHIGEVQSCNWNASASLDEDDPDTLVFEIRGSHGSGTLITRSETTDDGERVVAARLILPDGREVTVIPEPREPAPDADP